MQVFDFREDDFNYKQTYGESNLNGSIIIHFCHFFFLFLSY